MLLQRPVSVSSDVNVGSDLPPSKYSPLFSRDDVTVIKEGHSSFPKYDLRPIERKNGKHMNSWIDQDKSGDYDPRNTRQKKKSAWW